MDRIEQSRVWIIVIIKTIGRRFTTDIQIMKNLKKPEDAEDKCVVLSTTKNCHHWIYRFRRYVLKAFQSVIILRIDNIASKKYKNSL